MLSLPSDWGGHTVIYKECCGKYLCAGCIYADFTENNRTICPFCRTPQATSDREAVDRMKKRVESGDASAMNRLGCYYHKGMMGLPQNYKKGMKLLLRAGELEHTTAYYNLGMVYCNGQGVARDEKKAKYYYELAAMRGDANARRSLGIIEVRKGNMERAVKHWMISTTTGDDASLKKIREAFLRGHASKDFFEKALRAHKAGKDEMKSHQREAAVTDEIFRRAFLTDG